MLFICSAFFVAWHSMILNTIITPNAAIFIIQIISIYIMSLTSGGEALKAAHEKLQHRHTRLYYFKLCNQGILAIIFFVLIYWFLYPQQTAIAFGNNYKSKIEFIPFIPVYCQSIINLYLWVAYNGKFRDIGRIAFVIYDMPILIPITLILFLSNISRYITISTFRSDGLDFIISGATLAITLISIILSNCVKELLKNYSRTQHVNKSTAIRLEQ
jgi:hypothetical protein